MAWQGQKPNFTEHRLPLNSFDHFTVMLKDVTDSQISQRKALEKGKN